MPFWDRTIELVFITHEHAGHLTGGLAVLKRYRLKHFVAQNQDGAGIKTASLRALLAENNLIASYLKKGDRIDIAEQFSIEAVWPNKNSYKTDLKEVDHNKEIDNDSSLVLLSSFDRFKFLITGDVSTLLFSQDHNINNINIIKVPHHRGKGSLDEQSIIRLKPLVAVISVGKNKYGHPSTETINLLKKHNIMILRTGLNGEIETVSNGKEWKANLVNAPGL